MNKYSEKINTFKFISGILDKIFDLFQTVYYVLEQNLITVKESEERLSQLKDQDISGSFFCSYTGFIVLGHKSE